MPWKLQQGRSTTLKSPILIEGLPGIGNVGKIAADILVEQLKAKKIGGFRSYDMPHSVFVNEHNLVELPSITLHHTQARGKDFLILAGDTQPIDEHSCYEFCETLLTELTRLHCKEIVTLGGIGLAAEPKEPAVYITGNDRTLVASYLQNKTLKKDIFGVVGPIMGVTGLLVGLAKDHKIPSAALLAETLGHPMHIGLRGSRAILLTLAKRYGFSLDFKAIDHDIEEMEKDMQGESGEGVPKRLKRLGKFGETSYIG